MNNPTLEEVYIKAHKSPGCWELASKSATITLDGQRMPAHRAVWILWTEEPIPAKHVVLRSCQNNRCVRPDHLQCVDYPTFSRWAKNKTIVCPRGHVFAGENIQLDSKGHRRCRECARQRAYIHYHLAASRV